METSGLVRRQPDPDDARSTFAVLTPRGRSLVQKARRTHHAFLHEVFGSVLVDRDLSDLVRITGRLDASIAKGNLPE